MYKAVVLITSVFM